MSVLAVGKKAPEKTCYQWMVYVRSPANVDLSHVISTVRFKLHPSFNKPEKDVASPPYQLEKSGAVFQSKIVLSFCICRVGRVRYRC